MKRKKILLIIVSVLLVIAAGFVLVSGKFDLGNGIRHAVSFDFTFDDFKFMNHTLSEGNKMKVIMDENGIGMSEGAVNSKDYYVEEKVNYAQSLMCPADFGNAEVQRGWESAYVVSTVPEDGRISMCITKVQTEYESYYKGPIQIGDSFDQVYDYLHIDEIKKCSIIEEKHNRRYYTCDTNLGTITFKEAPSTEFDDFYQFKDPKDYLMAGNSICYDIKTNEYFLRVTVDETQTVSNISLSYDPNHVLDDFTN